MFLSRFLSFSLSLFLFLSLSRSLSLSLAFSLSFSPSSHEPLGIEAKRLLSLSMKTQLSELRQEIGCSVDVAGKLDAKATAILRDKKEMWKAIEVRVITRTSFAIDPILTIHDRIFESKTVNVCPETPVDIHGSSMSHLIYSVMNRVPG